MRHKTIRIDPAFDNPGKIRAMLEENAPYHAVAAYAPSGIVDETKEHGAVLPWFRGNWAVGGKPLVKGAESILWNKKFLEVAKACFRSESVEPEFVVINVNAPMPAGATHIDNPSFHGATRENYPLPLLRVMGHSGLFEAWRVVRASSIAWFYEGPGGNFEYWPEGFDGPMMSERSPFNNVALCADTDGMYHRIGAIGDPAAESPCVSAAAQIQSDGDGHWSILENGEVCAMYPDSAIRFSILWKAAIGGKASNSDNLTLDRIISIFSADLRHRSVEFQLPSDPLTDRAWILLLQRIYSDPTATEGT
jgi:hypothetical protein